MNKDLRQKTALGLLLVAGLGLGILLNSNILGTGQTDRTVPPNETSLDDASWMNQQLQTVERERNFTISELERPVLLETFAVWCTTCSRQQQEIKQLHEEMNVTSVSLNVDQNEDKEKILNHKKQNNFDWIYAVSPIELTNQLRERFGNSVANPPSAPVILICDGKAVRLEKERFGSPVKSSAFLKQRINDTCTEDSKNKRSGSGAVS